MWGEMGTLEERDRLQLDLDRLQGWLDENRIGFTTDKCKVLHLGRKNQQHTYRLLYTSPSPRDVEESRMPSSA